MRMLSLCIALGSLFAAQAPQAPNPTLQPNPIQPSNPMPVYRVTVVARTTKAINYRHRSGSTKIDFRGTPLLPEARGYAHVESNHGVIKIDAKMDKLQPATTHRPEHLTYDI